MKHIIFIIKFNFSDVPFRILPRSSQVAIWIDDLSSYYLQHGWQRSQLNVGIVPIPISTPNDKTTLLQATGYTISAFTQQPDAAWRWVNLLNRQEIINASLDGPTIIPARQTVFQNSVFWSSIDPELEATIQYALGHA